MILYTVKCGLEIVSEGEIRICQHLDADEQLGSFMRANYRNGRAIIEHDALTGHDHAVIILPAERTLGAGNGRRRMRNV